MQTFDPAAIGVRARQARKAAGLTTRQIAGVSPATVSNVESGNVHNFTTATLARLAQATHSSADWLLFGDNPESSPPRLSLTRWLALTDSLGITLESGKNPIGETVYILKTKDCTAPDACALIAKYARIRKLHASGALSDEDFTTLLNKYLEVSHV